MWPESKDSGEPNGSSEGQKLRTGLTTGSCATACCVAAAHLFFNGDKKNTVTVSLPKKRQAKPISISSQSGALNELSDRLIEHKQVEMVIHSLEKNGETIRAATIKDAGDDPDATHGAEVFVELALTAQAGITFKAAQGVGTVTRDGLLLPVGEPAINPVPRQMMIQHLTDIAQQYHYSGGFEVSVGVVKGESIALKTMNPRLGILGGLSILGTTGIVRPFSCAAYIASIHQGIDVASSNGHHHIGASTGTSSERVITQFHDLPDMALIEMGDFVGAVLKYLKKSPQGIQKLTLCGGFGKITKLAQGHMDLHSRASSIDLNFIAEVAKEAGANTELQLEIRQANTSIQALNLCQVQSIPLAEGICQRAMAKIQSVIPSIIEVEVWAINRQGQRIAAISSS